MEITELKSGMLVRDGVKLLKVSEVYDTYATMQLLLEGRPSKAPRRTTVRHYGAVDIDLLIDEPTSGQMRRYDEVYSIPR